MLINNSCSNLDIHVLAQLLSFSRKAQAAFVKSLANHLELQGLNFTHLNGCNAKMCINNK